MFLQDVPDGGQIWPLGNGSHHVSVIVEHRQPGSQASRDLADIIGVHMMPFQLFYHIDAGTALIHYAHEGGPQLDIRDIFSHIAADASVDLHHSSHVSSGRDKIGKWIAFNVDKNRAKHNNSHQFSTSSSMDWIRPFRRFSAAAGPSFPE